MCSSIESNRRLAKKETDPTWLWTWRHKRVGVVTLTHACTRLCTGLHMLSEQKGRSKSRTVCPFCVTVEGRSPKMEPWELPSAGRWGWHPLHCLEARGWPHPFLFPHSTEGQHGRGGHVHSECQCGSLMQGTGCPWPPCEWGLSPGLAVATAALGSQPTVLMALNSLLGLCGKHQRCPWEMCPLHFQFYVFFLYNIYIF